MTSLLSVVHSKDTCYVSSGTTNVSYSCPHKLRRLSRRHGLYPVLCVIHISFTSDLLVRSLKVLTVPEPVPVQITREGPTYRGCYTVCFEFCGVDGVPQKVRPSFLTSCFNSRDVFVTECSGTSFSSEVR